MPPGSIRWRPGSARSAARLCHRQFSQYRTAPRPIHNVRRGRAPIDRIYEEVEDGLSLNDGAREFLMSHQQVLSLLSIDGWVQLTEQFTFAPGCTRRSRDTRPSENTSATAHSSLRSKGLDASIAVLKAPSCTLTTSSRGRSFWKIGMEPRSVMPRVQLRSRQLCAANLIV